MLATPAAPKSRESSDIASGNIVAPGVNAPASWGEVIGEGTIAEKRLWGDFLIKVVIENGIEQPFDHFKTGCLLCLHC